METKSLQLTNSKDGFRALNAYALVHYNPSTLLYLDSTILQKICCGADAHSHDDNISWDSYFLTSLRFETDGHVIDRLGLGFPVELDTISFMELITKREPMINRTKKLEWKGILTFFNASPILSPNTARSEAHV